MGTLNIPIASDKKSKNNLQEKNNKRLLLFIREINRDSRHKLTTDELA